MLDDQTNRLLAEIRDLQREHLAEYRRVTAEILEGQRLTARHQQEAMERTRAFASLYRKVLVVAALVVGLLVLVLVWIAANPAR